MSPKPDRRFTPSHFKFHNLKKTVLAYSKRTGRQVSYRTKKGTVRKNVRRVVKQTLIVVDKRTGELHKYGSINERELKKVGEVKASGRNVMIRQALMDAGIWAKLAKKGASGVRIRIKGKGEGAKVRRAVIDVILDAGKLNDETYIMRTVLAKVLNKLGQNKMRLSDESISKHKKYDQLTGITFGVETFGEGDGGEDDEDAEENTWEEESYTSEPKRKKRKAGKRRKRKKRRK